MTDGRQHDETRRWPEKPKSESSWITWSWQGIALWLLIIAGGIWMAMPNIHYAPERAKVSRMQYDFRNLRTQAAMGALDVETSLTLPIDVFSERGEPVNLLLTSGALLAVSRGPDKTYDAATIQYDATNGTISRGDLFTTLAVNVRYSVPE